MRKVFATLAFMFVFTVTAFAAELPSLGDDFPTTWKQVRDESCIYKGNITFHIRSYDKTSEEGTRMITTFDRNDVRVGQQVLLLSHNGLIHISTDVVADGVVTSFVGPRESFDPDKVNAAHEKAFKVKREEFQSCFRSVTSG